MIVRRGQPPRVTEGGVEARRLSDAGGVTQFGLHIHTLPPGGRSSDRHWHETEDELLYVLSGEATVIEGDATHVLGPGDAACWPAGVSTAHQVLNRSAAPCSYLICGTRVLRGAIHYPEDGSICRFEGRRWQIHGPEGELRREGVEPPRLPLRTARLVLRPFTASDVDAFVAYRADPEVARLQSWSDFSRADGERFLVRNTAATLGEGWYQIAIELDGALVGDVAVNGRGPREAELGFTLARSAWGRGLAREAVEAVMGLLVRDGVERFEATVDARNTRARRLLEGLGFCRSDTVQTVFKGAPCEELVYRCGRW